MRQSTPLCCSLNAIGQSRVEHHGFKAHQLLGFNRHALALGQRGQKIGQTALCGLQTLLIRVAQVHGEGGPAGDDIDQVRLQAQRPDRGEGGFRRRAHHLLAQESHASRSCVAGIVAQPRGRGTCVVGHTGDGHLLPGDALQALHHADEFAFGLQHRALLDVQFDVLARHDGARRHVTRVANAGQLVTQACSVGAHGVERCLHIHATGIHQRAHHVRLVAHAFFVGERRHHNGTRRAQASLPVSTHHGQARQHAIAAIQRACIAHGVDVRPHHQRLGRALGVLCVQHAEDVADLVHAHFQVQLAHPAHQQVTPGFFFVGQGNAGAAALRCIVANGTEFAKLLQQFCGVQQGFWQGHVGSFTGGWL